jgi:hypothetical protein
MSRNFTKILAGLISVPLVSHSLGDGNLEERAKKTHLYG